MLIPLLAAFLLQAGSDPKPMTTPAPPVWEAAHPALMAKAPGAPGYGVQFTTANGKVVFTNLHFDPATRVPKAELFRLRGPVGMGPYRAGLELGFTMKSPVVGPGHPSWFDSFYYVSGVVEGSPAKEAGLKREEYTPNPFKVIEGVDGSNWDWDLGNLIWHISNSPVIEINRLKRPMFGGPSRWNTKLTLRKIDVPPDPADGSFEPGGVKPALIQPWLEAAQMWKDLLILRSRTPRTAPFATVLQGGPRWVVAVPLNPGEAKAIHGLEVWREDPLTGPYPFDKAITDVWQEPAEGLGTGQTIRLENQWYRIQAMDRDSSGRLTVFNLSPWEPHIQALLSGSTLAGELGTLRTPKYRETLEGQGNDALIEWKTRTLPGLLATHGQGSAEEMVIRIEKGILTLDLAVKGIRSRMDTAARAEAEHKAQAELASKNGQPVPPVQVAPSAESEMLADLLEQRKAILMAILGSAKQSLANLRR